MEELSAEQLASRAGASAEEIERFARLGILSRDAAPFRPPDVTRVRLLRALDRSGVAVDDIGRAIGSGQFSFAFVDALFPTAGNAALADVDFEEMCRRFGFPMDFVQDVYAGLGLPQPSPKDRLRQDDLDMAPVLLAFLGLPVGRTEGAIPHATRFWGEQLRLLAMAETRFFETYVMRPLLASGLTERALLEIA